MTMMTFSDARLAKLNGFKVELNAEMERADIVLDRPPLNVIEMPQREDVSPSITKRPPPVSRT